MSNLTKVAVPTIILLAIYMIYHLTPGEGLGSFEKYKSSGEINQAINVAVVTSRGFGRDQNNKIVSFVARDKDGVESRVSLNNPAPEAISAAQVVELFGHMHGPDFVAARVTIVK
ncbi:MAG: hypothetical protein H6627_00160 [Calditrichae bacterium]|nr:hypothetical protein [Calditrichota bacterium]MCB9056951.1 hypothetical protein [Calditrichia bacterium]